MKKNDQQIHFILTGGTIDSYYDGLRDTVVPYKSSCIPDYIIGLNLYNESIFYEVHLKASFDEIMMKDSREVTKNDMYTILGKIENTKHKKIIITHGTYTIPDTARFLERNLKRKDQTVILTGSFIPLKGFTPSDAPFNIGFAIAKIQDLDPGVYVCMNARVFKPNEVAKNIAEGKYISLKDE